MKLFFTLMTLLLVSNISFAQSIQDKFVGAWKLVSIEETAKDGSLIKAECTGLLIYTKDRYMAVQVMYLHPEKMAPSQYTLNGYEATYGTYKIDEKTNSFDYEVQSALARKLIGKKLKRVFELSGNQLIIKSSDPKEHWRVTWQKS